MLHNITMLSVAAAGGLADEEEPKISALVPYGCRWCALCIDPGCIVSRHSPPAGGKVS